MSRSYILTSPQARAGGLPKPIKFHRFLIGVLPTPPPDLPLEVTLGTIFDTQGRRRRILKGTPYDPNHENVLFGS